MNMLVIYQSTVSDTSVNCQWYISQLSVAYQSHVNLEGESKREQVSDRPAWAPCGFGSFSRFVVSFVVNFDVQNGIVSLSVDQLLTDTSVKYRPTIGEVSVKVSAKCWQGISKVSVD